MFTKSRFALFLITMCLCSASVRAEDAPPEPPALPAISGGELMPGLDQGPPMDLPPPLPPSAEPVVPISAPTDVAPPAPDAVAPISAPMPDNSMPPAPTADNSLPPLPGATPPATPAPSNNADASIPQLPPLGDAPPAPAKDASSVIDSFFSDTKIIPEQQPTQPPAPLPEQQASVPLPEDSIKPKKVVRRAPPKPAYNYKSQILPPSIYKKSYSSQNRHLPRAVGKEDLADKMAIVIARGDLEDAKALNKFGVSLTTLLPSGDTPLTLATRYQKPYIMQWLLSQGAPVNDTDVNGFSALHYAAFGGSSEMVDMLLSYGADPNIIDTRGLTPLVYANIRGAQGIESVIRSFGGVM